MGEVVPLTRPCLLPQPTEPPNPGNGAREAAVMYWRAYLGGSGFCNCDGHTGMMADNLLGFLWNEGFKVVPLGPDDAPYDGPEWTGEETPG